MKSSDSGLPFLPWYPGRFLSSTRGWPVTARGVYRELLDCQWEMASLPPKPLELQRLIGATNAEWKYWALLIEPKFPLDNDGRRRNRQLEQHRARSVGLRERNRAGAAKTNAKRYGNKVVPFPNTGARDDR
ncbi:MAG: YdaU family protein [Pseudomonadota bacterium]|nr:YdaU family protein [Pseudomonadota bacterium]